MSQIYELYNHSYPAAVLETEGTEPGFILHAQVLDPERIPFPMRGKRGKELCQAAEHWICHRLIPKFRPGMDRLYAYIGPDRVKNAFSARLMSLSDGYWVRTPKETVTWDMFNFHRNRFSYDVGNFVFGIETGSPDLYSPDFTLNGQMPKTWRRKGGDTYLLKSGSGPYYEEPAHEEAASRILQTINKSTYVIYQTEQIRGRLYSVCRNFVKDGTEFVPACDLIAASPDAGFLPNDQVLQKQCQRYRIPGYQEYFDTLHCIDYLIANRDRHYGNFGFLYDVKDRVFLGPAPIFDCGTSFWNADPHTLPDELPQTARDQAAKMAGKLSRIDQAFMIPPETVKEILEDSLSKTDLKKEWVVRVLFLAMQRAAIGAEVLERAAEQKLEQSRKVLENQEIEI